MTTDGIRAPLFALLNNQSHELAHHIAYYL